MKKKKMEILLLFSSVALLILFLFSDTLAGNNVFGWAWSSNIGWISFNCYNDYNGDGIRESHCADAGYQDYGVNIEDNGSFSGYAWSERIGWITFNQSELLNCPLEPCEARVDLLTGEISGWARACNVFQSGCSGPLKDNLERGGWDGWIKLKGTTVSGQDYNAKIELSSSRPKPLKGFAWGGDDTNEEGVIGWISFSSENCDSDDDQITDQGNYSNCPIGQTISKYGVFTDFSFPPTATNLKVSGTYCRNPRMIFSWEFQDPDPEDFQSAFRIQVDKDGNWDNSSNTPGEWDSGKVNSSVASSYVLISDSSEIGKLEYNTDYNWRLMVWDNTDTTSTDWILGPSFTTPKHRYPYVEFEWKPQSPTQDEFVQFCSRKQPPACKNDLTICYKINNQETNCPDNGFLWTFPPEVEFATGSSPTSKNPLVKFTQTGEVIVSLQVTDSSGYSCSTSSPVIRVTPPLPKWKEIKPK